MLGAEAAMPNLDLAIRQSDSTLGGALFIDALFDQLLLHLHAAGFIPGEGFLIGTIPRSVVYDVRHVESELTGTGKSRLVTLPRRITRMKRRGAIDKKRKQLEALRISMAWTIG